MAARSELGTVVDNDVISITVRLDAGKRVTCASAAAMYFQRGTRVVVTLDDRRGARCRARARADRDGR